MTPTFWLLILLAMETDGWILEITSSNLIFGVIFSFFALREKTLGTNLVSRVLSPWVQGHVEKLVLNVLNKQIDEDFEKKTSDLSAMFSSFQSYLDEDQDIREKISVAVRDIEQTTREILAVLQAVHHSSHQEDIVKTCQKANSLFTNVKDQFSQLITKIPAGQYYRFHDHWRFVSQRASFLASFLVYLQFDRLITREEVAVMLGLKVKREDGFHIDLNDFLMGLLLLANELSRYAVNCVTAGEYEQPQKIASFVSQLDAGFRLLNLKNDALRRKFDGLKYDLKKIEEVVYDIKIRGLKNS